MIEFTVIYQIFAIIAILSVISIINSKKRQIMKFCIPFFHDYNPISIERYNKYYYNSLGEKIIEWRGVYVTYKCNNCGKIIIKDYKKVGDITLENFKTKKGK
ncbi:MAG: hypothetical protein BV456_09625 [Thermoplasmata archaeon M8B2D]|nr:MAG: hypothetical protein BV456_09625 [Thermoplasmata archaeon M8B2D]